MISLNVYLLQNTRFQLDVKWSDTSRSSAKPENPNLNFLLGTNLKTGLKIKTKMMFIQ